MSVDSEKNTDAVPSYGMWKRACGKKNVGFKHGMLKKANRKKIQWIGGGENPVRWRLLLGAPG